EGRPIMTGEDRAIVVAALRAVDFVSIFGEDTPFELISAVLPNVIVKGGDYDPGAESGPEYIIGSDIVRAHGGEVKVIPFIEGKSTSGLIERIAKSEGNRETSIQSRQSE